MTAPRGRHAASRRRPVRLAWLWLLANVADLARGLVRTGELSDEDTKVVLWVDGIKVPDAEPAPAPDPGVIHGPHPPARRPQVLTVARVRAAAIIRALPLDAVPHLRRGQYKDSTGTFTAIAAAPPVLHADESVSMTPAAMAAGLAEQHLKEWTP